MVIIFLTYLLTRQCYLFILNTHLTGKLFVELHHFSQQSQEIVSIKKFELFFGKKFY